MLQYKFCHLTGSEHSWNYDNTINISNLVKQDKGNNFCYAYIWLPIWLNENWLMY
jgi:hypothetical protein